MRARWHQFRNPNFYLMLTADACLFATALISAYLVRFDFALPPAFAAQIPLLLVILIPLKLLVYYNLDLYRGLWRYTSLLDILRLCEATALGFVTVTVLLLYRERFAGYSRAVFLMDGVFTFLLTAGLRVAIRMGFLAVSRHRSQGNWGIFRRSERNARRVLIIGAGDAGQALMRELAADSNSKLALQCFVDDDPRKSNRAINGIPVIGPVDMLPDIIDRYRIQELYIAVPSANGNQMRRIVDQCERSQLPYKTLPAITSMLHGKGTRQSLRHVYYEDLLGRQAVKLDQAGISEYLRDRTILVTGGGGSIGSELCRRLIRYKPGRIVIFDASEFNLYRMEMELKHEIKFHEYEGVLGLVQDRELVERVFARYRPDVIFHAAAYKHVPMLERNPWEAVFNNIEGSRTVMEAARSFRSERFVLVSTDKAVRPVNVMGASKRVAEMILQNQPAGRTRYMAVRFGNVLGSAGSVVPLFRRQIELGGPVTVTDPRMTRYFMTIPEAAQLILQAGSMGEGGEIFILDMGVPVNIAEMAKDLIKLSGREPGKDIEIVFTGLRQGEKLYEELMTEGEDILPTSHEKIKRLSPTSNAMEGTSETSRVARLVAAAGRYDAAAIKSELSDLVPEYSPQQGTAVLEASDVQDASAIAGMGTPTPDNFRSARLP
jgi:FlaA1/EpsC-like NDP-sugar epimerase